MEDTSSSELLASLEARANALLSELTTFQEYLKSSKQDQRVEVRHFKNNIQSEFKSLDKARAAHANGTANSLEIGPEEQEQEAKRLHLLRSSNLPFYEAVWSVAKGCRGIKALAKKVCLDFQHASQQRHCDRKKMQPPQAPKTVKDQKKGILVDIIADNGAEWVKVSTVTEKRLLFEMAKQGWEGYGPDSDSESEEDEHLNSSLERPPLELVRLAEDLQAASAQTRIHYQHPRVRIVLPHISEGSTAAVDAVLKDLRATGALVECSDSTVLGMEKLTLNVSTTFKTMLPKPPDPLTSTVNIDCTLLLALISDISHLQQSDLPSPPSSSSYHSAIIRQIAAEQSSPLLPTELYPALANRDLICTSEAARRAREIVDTMGTFNERARVDVIFADGNCVGQGAEALRRALEGVTAYPVPMDLRLPIREIDFSTGDAFALLNEPQCHSFPARVAKAASEAMRLSPINLSVIMYSWREGITICTSNKVIAAGLEKTINGILDEVERGEYATGNGGDLNRRELEAFQGPLVWVCDTARSLVGKEKGRR